MKLNSEITPESYRKFSHILAKNRTKQRNLLLIEIIIFIFIILPLAISKYLTGSFSWGIIFELYTVFISVLLVLFFYKRMKTIYSKLGNANYGIWSFELEDNGLRIINNEHFNKLYLYNAFIDAYVKDDLLLIIFGPYNGIHIQISDMNRAKIPEFLDALKKKIGEA